MDAPIQALKNLNVPFEYVFASETDAWCIETICANHAPREIYGDVRRRDMKSTPYVDLYVCGFPCQPFSLAGARKGLDDARGTIFAACADYIRTQRPRYFVLENVRNLLAIDGGRTWKHILGCLESIPGYSVNWALMNCKDYGVPQHRRRIYIVGVRDATTPFRFPAKRPCKAFEDQRLLVDTSDTQPSRPSRQLSIAQSLDPLLERRGACFVDTLQYRTEKRVPQRGFAYATCLLTTSYVWCVPMKRWANRKELLRMQGFPDSYHIVVPERKFWHQVGNAMSVNVVECILRTLLLPHPSYTT